MQRECNDVAFGELILSTRLNKKIHPKSEMKDVVESCNSWTCRCWWSPPQEGIAFTTVLQQIVQVFTNQYIDSSTWTLLWRFWTSTITWDVSNQPNGKTDAARRQVEGCVMMTTNKRPLIMTWSKTAPKGTKRANVASTTMMWLAKSTGLS